MHHKYKPSSHSRTTQVMGYLVEECGEVMHAAGKCIRNGLTGFNPDLPPEQQETNKQWLKRELDDLEYAIKLMKEKLK